MKDSSIVQRRPVTLTTTAPEARLDEEIEVAAALAAQGITAYEKATLFTQVQELAVVDELTQDGRNRVRTA